MASNKIYIEFEEIFPKLKQRTELLLRAHSIHELVITDSFKDLIEDFFSEAFRSYTNQYFGEASTEFHDDTVIFELPDELNTKPFKAMQGLIEKAFLQHILSQWFRVNGAMELHQEALDEYDKAGKELKNSSRKPGYVRPKPRPYF